MLTKEGDPFEVLNSHLENETSPGCNQHCHQHRGPSNLVMKIIILMIFGDSIGVKLKADYFLVK